MVLRQSQQYKAEGYVYPGGRIEFRKAVVQKKQFPAPLGCPIRTRQIYSPKALNGRDGGLGLGRGKGVGWDGLEIVVGMVNGCWVATVLGMPIVGRRAKARPLVREAKRRTRYRG
jgi:hypothetical protein